MQKSLIFKNRVQAMLFAIEISGQLSDGAWENSRPLNHWRELCYARIGYGKNPMKVNVYPRRKYNFARRDLLEIPVVLERMIFYSKMAMLFPEAKTQEISVMEDLVVIGPDYYSSKNEDYWKRQQTKAEEFLDTVLLEISGFNEKVQKIKEDLDKIPYVKKNLVNDLKEMSNLVNNRRSISEDQITEVVWIGEK